MTPAWFALVGWALGAMFFVAWYFERRARRDADKAIAVYSRALDESRFHTEDARNLAIELSRQLQRCKEELR